MRGNRSRRLTLTTSSAFYVSSASLSCPHAAAQAQRAELGSCGATLVDPRSWADWVMRTFVLLGRFEDFAAVFDPGSLTNRGLRSALAFDTRISFRWSRAIKIRIVLR